MIYFEKMDRLLLQFGNNIELTFYDKNNVKIDMDENPEKLTSESKVYFLIDWLIENDVSATIEDGDYYELELPKIFNLDSKEPIPMLNDANEDMGSFEIKDNKVIFTFLKVGSLYKGSAGFNGKLNPEEIKNTGKQEIDWPMEDNYPSDIIIYPDNYENAMSKKASLESGKIKWIVDFNKNYQTLNNPVLKDILSQGLIYDEGSFKAHRLFIDIEGNQTIDETEIPLTFNSTEKKITINKEEINYPIRVEYTTSFTDAIKETIGKKTFTNSVELLDSDLDPVSASIELDFANYVNKFNGVDKPADTETGRYVEWKIILNQKKVTIPAGEILKDTVSEGLSFHKDTLRIYKEDNSEYTGSYQVDINNDQTPRKLEITFEDSFSETLTLIYRTTIDDGAIVGAVEFNNKVEFMGDVSNSIAKYGAFNSITKGLQGGNKNSYASIDHNEREVHWFLEVNHFGNTMKNAVIKDEFRALSETNKGLEYIAGSLVVKSLTKNEDLALGEDYNFDLTDKGFNISLIGKYNVTNEKLRITYSTRYDMNHLTSHVIGNDVKLEYSDLNDKFQNPSNGFQYGPNDLDNKIKFNGSKTGSYNATKKEIEWTNILNYNNEILENAIFKDKIAEDQTFVEDSLQIIPYIIFENKVVEEEPLNLESLPKDFNVTYPKNSNNTLLIKFPNTKELENGKFIVRFKTSLKDQVIKENYSNTSIFENNSKSQNYKANVSIENGNTFLDKKGIQVKDEEGKDTNQVKYTVTVNPSQSTINNAKIKDIWSSNQSVDVNSIKLYKTNVSATGTISKTEEYLSLNDDYTIANIHTTDGKNGFEINFSKPLEEAYILEYNATIFAHYTDNTLSNNIILEGNDTTYENKGGEVSFAVAITDSFANANAVKANLSITKTDGENPLVGSEFALTYVPLNSVVRTFKTDENGQILFEGLFLGEYNLKEINATPGYVINKTFSYDGLEINLKEDGINFEITENDLDNDNTFTLGTKITNEKNTLKIKKIRPDNNTISGAKFKLEYFDNTLEEWIVRDEELILTDGFITVRGLLEGTYRLIELEAPNGYIPLEQALEFIVEFDDYGHVKDDGRIIIDNEIKVLNIKSKEINITKEWVNGPIDKSNLTYTVQLFRKLETEDETEFKPYGEKVTLPGKQLNQKIIVEETDIDGNEYVYKVDEVSVPKNYTPTIDGFNITNTYSSPRKDITVTKKWVNGDKDNRPEITLTLYRNIEGEAKEVVETVILNQSKVDEDSEGNWIYAWLDLPETNQLGQEYIYTVEEADVENYNKNINGFVITNTYDIPKGNITVWKQWIGGPDERPSIELQLLRNGENFGELITLENGESHYVFEDLELYDINGKKHTFSVKEVNVPEGYESAVEGLIVKNTYIEKPVVPVEPVIPEEPTIEPELPETSVKGDSVTLPLTGSVAVLPMLGIGFISLAAFVWLLGLKKEN